MNNYAELRAAVDDGSFDLDQIAYIKDVRALLAERDALREALEMMVEMVEMNGFGRDYAMDVARAALAQNQGD